MPIQYIVSTDPALAISIRLADLVTVLAIAGAGHFELRATKLTGHGRERDCLGAHIGYQLILVTLYSNEGLLPRRHPNILDLCGLVQKLVAFALFAIHPIARQALLFSAEPNLTRLNDHKLHISREAFILSFSPTDTFAEIKQDFRSLKDFGSLER